MDAIHSTYTAAEVRAWFVEHGVAIADWARAHQFDRNQVYGVLSGRLRGRRGQAHRIAVLLGLKSPEAVRNDLDARLDPSLPSITGSRSDCVSLPESCCDPVSTERRKPLRHPSRDATNEEEVSGGQA